MSNNCVLKYEQIYSNEYHNVNTIKYNKEENYTILYCIGFSKVLEFLYNDIHVNVSFPFALEYDFGNFKIKIISDFKTTTLSKILVFRKIFIKDSNLTFENTYYDYSCSFKLPGK